MPTYCVRLTRMQPEFCTLVLDADTEEDAIFQALEDGGTDWDSYNMPPEDMQVDDVQRIPFEELDAEDDDAE